MSRIIIAHEITPAQPQTKTQTPIYDADTEQAKKSRTRKDRKIHSSDNGGIMKPGECCPYGQLAIILESKNSVCRLAGCAVDLIEVCPLTFCEFDFSTALTILKHGGKVARSCWERGTYITIPNIEEKEPVFFIINPHGHAFIWGIPRDAILAEDWRVVQ